MKIVSQSAAGNPVVNSSEMHALKMELDRLKEEVSILRAARTPSPTPPLRIGGSAKAVVAERGAGSAQPAAPAVIRAPQDPLFAQLWAYVTNEK